MDAIHRAPLLRAAKQHPAACAAGGAPLLRLAGAPPSLLVVVVELGRDAHEYRNVVAKDPLDALLEVALGEPELLPECAVRELTQRLRLGAWE